MGKLEKPRYRIYFNVPPSGMTGHNKMIFVPLDHPGYFCIVYKDGTVNHRVFPGGSYAPGWPHLTLEKG